MRGGPLSNHGPYRNEIWRLVEAQHRVSTMKLVDSPHEQETLEELLDATKPPVPDECSHLHWLLFTPFRYDARTDSRFRREGRGGDGFLAPIVLCRKPGNTLASKSIGDDRIFSTGRDRNLFRPDTAAV